MSRKGIPKSKDVVPNRDLLMLAEYLEGSTMKAIGKKYGLSTSGVAFLATRDNWKGLLKKKQEEDLKATLDRLPVVVAKGVLAIESDVDYVLKEIKRNKGKTNHDDITRVRLNTQFIENIYRLDQGKPTANINQSTNGPTVFRIPKGELSPCIIPLDPRKGVIEEYDPVAEAKPITLEDVKNAKASAEESEGNNEDA